MEARSVDLGLEEGWVGEKGGERKKKSREQVSLRVLSSFFAVSFEQRTSLT